MNKTSNFPNAQPVKVKPGEMGAMVAKMEDLRGRSIPKTDEEIEERIKFFFNWCVENDIRPGVELMALCLGTTRVTLWEWQKKGGRRGELITLAKQVLAALLEQWGVTGKINPATLCFMMKNHYGYHDDTKIEISTEENAMPKERSLEIVQRRKLSPPSLPDFELSDN